MRTIQLFEYGNWVSLANITERELLESYLCEIWQRRIVPTYKEYSEDTIPGDTKWQPFCSFDGANIRANNYVGFIQCHNVRIEVFPKIFADNPVISTSMMHKHILQWLMYSKKMVFPIVTTESNTLMTQSFPEIILYIMIKKIHAVVTEMPLSLYEEMNDSLTAIKGRIVLNRYLSTHFSKGQGHQVDCRYESYIYNNKVNQSIKYVTRLVKALTTYNDTLSLCDELLFILDEVEDRVCTSFDLQNVGINPYFAEYQDVIKLCMTILDQQIYASETGENAQYCLLLPMEVLFEDYVLTMIEKYFYEDYKIEGQKSDLYLIDIPQAFRMRHDILMTHRTTGKEIVIDTKYKMRKYDRADMKAGISQMDMYQMVSYAFKRHCEKVFLLYPNPNIESEENPTINFVISNSSLNHDITITAKSIPFWTYASFAVMEEQFKNHIQELLL